jgi:cystathionine beta-lyase/cystathionine gamma-synthase
LFSFELLNPTFEAVKTVMSWLNMFKIGVSWGSVESLALTPNDGKNAEQLRQDGINPGLIRLSAGLEDADVLIHDLDAALHGLS